MLMNHNKAVGLEIRKISNLIKRQYEKCEYKCHMTELNGWIVDFLIENMDKDIFQKDLEEKFSMRRSTASKMIQLMEQKGIVERKDVDYDKRLKKIILTDKALKLHAMANKDIESLENRISYGLTKEELDLFFTVTEKIKNNLK